LCAGNNRTADPDQTPVELLWSSFLTRSRVTLLTARADNNLLCMPIRFGLAQKNPLFA